MSKVFIQGLVATAGLGALVWFIKKSAKKPKKPAKITDFSVTDDFKDMFPTLVDYLVDHLSVNYQLDSKLQERVRWMLNYNVLGGKLYRGGLTVSTVQELCRYKGLDYSKYKEKAIVLGWCTEILQACFLVADDVMDKSVTRRGQPCWYKQESVQFDAVNDSLILEAFIFVLLKKYFGDEPALRLKIIDLYQSVMMTTEMGQMWDLVSQPQGAKSSDVLQNFSPATYKKIIHYKTSCYTFYLSAAAAMTLVGCQAKEDFDVVYKICLKLGENFQIQDDYLDAFGDAAVLGKIGTDIQDHKCTWLCVQALRLMNTQQREYFEAIYGKDDEESVKKVKQLYRDLKLPELYQQSQQEIYGQCVEMIQSVGARLPADGMFLPILKKLHGRNK